MHVRRSPYLVVVEGDVAPVNLLLVVVDLLHLEHVPDKHHRRQQHSAIFFLSHDIVPSTPAYETATDCMAETYNVTVPMVSHW